CQPAFPGFVLFRNLIWSYKKDNRWEDMSEENVALRQQPRTMLDKLWSAHEVARREDGQSLLWIDRHFLHEGSFHAFDQLRTRGARVARPDLAFGVADHYVPTRAR